MNLQLSLKKQWFEMTKLGLKTEDYREINDYWEKRLLNFSLNYHPACVVTYFKTHNINHNLKHFTQNTMTLGYPKSNDTERILKLEHKGIEIRTGNPEWGAEPNKLYFVILHGSVLAK